MTDRSYLPQHLYYLRCCRVHRLVMGYPVRTCGICGHVPDILATEVEYLAQPPLELHAVDSSV